MKNSFCLFALLWGCTTGGPSAAIEQPTADWSGPIAGRGASRSLSEFPRDYETVYEGCGQYWKGVYRVNVVPTSEAGQPYDLLSLSPHDRVAGPRDAHGEVVGADIHNLLVQFFDLPEPQSYTCSGDMDRHVVWLQCHDGVSTDFYGRPDLCEVLFTRVRQSEQTAFVPPSRGAETTNPSPHNTIN